MQLTWLGHSCFKIQAKTINGEIIIVTDPYNKEIGVKMPKITADIITVSHNHYDHNKIEEVQGAPFIIDGPGEYEIKGIFVHGVASFHDKQEGKERGANTIFAINLLEEEIAIVHLGDLGHILNNEELEYLENVDILLIPVGGKYTIDAKDAVGVINQIEPRIVIPMHYKMPYCKIDDIAGVDIFCKEMGVCVEKMNKLKIFKKDLPQDEIKVIILER